MYDIVGCPCRQGCVSAYAGGSPVHDTVPLLSPVQLASIEAGLKTTVQKDSGSEGQRLGRGHNPRLGAPQPSRPPDPRPSGDRRPGRRRRRVHRAGGGPLRHASGQHGRCGAPPSGWTGRGGPGMGAQACSPRAWRHGSGGHCRRNLRNGSAGLPAGPLRGPQSGAATRSRRSHRPTTAIPAASAISSGQIRLSSATPTGFSPARRSRYRSARNCPTGPGTA